MKARSDTPIATRLIDQSIPEPNSGCHLWLGAFTKAGYGVLMVRRMGGLRYAHRAAYEVEEGPIDRGLTIDHLCGNTGCINPRHMEAVPNVTNVMRGNGLGVQNAKKPACPQGHLYDDANTRITVRGARECRTCLRAHARRRYRSRKAIPS